MFVTVHSMFMGCFLCCCSICLIVISYSILVSYSHNNVILVIYLFNIGSYLQYLIYIIDGIYLSIHYTGIEFQFFTVFQI